MNLALGEGITVLELFQDINSEFWISPTIYGGHAQVSNTLGLVPIYIFGDSRINCTLLEQEEQ